MTLAFDYRKTHKTHSRGTRAAQPLATDVLDGTLYFVTDEGVIERSNGTAWESYSGAGGAASRGNPGPPGMDAEEAETSFMIAGPAGSVTTPGGLTTQVQFNLAGAFAGDADLTFATDTLTATKIVASQVAVGTGAIINSSVLLTVAGTFTAAGAIARGINVAPTITMAVNAEGYGVLSAPAFVIAGSGTHPMVAGFGLQVPTASGSGAAVTVATSCYIPSAPTFGSSNYAMFVAGGATRLDGGIVSGASNPITVTPAAGSNLAVVLSTTGDFTVNTNDIYVDTSNNNVGFGTSAPDNTAFNPGVSRTVHLKDVTDGTVFRMEGASNLEIGSGVNSWFWVTTNTTLGFATNNTTRAVFTAVGNFTVERPITMKNFTVATLPAGVRGDIAYVTDALAPAFLAIVAGGGAVVTPVFYNGANWVGF